MCRSFFQFAINSEKRFDRRRRSGEEGTELPGLFFFVNAFVRYYSGPFVKGASRIAMINSKRNANNRPYEQKARPDKRARNSKGWGWWKNNRDSSSSIGSGTFNSRSELEGQGKARKARQSELMRKFNAAVTCPSVTKSTCNVIKSALPDCTRVLFPPTPSVL